MAKKKTTAQHAAEVKKLGRLVLIGEYNGAHKKTKYYCPQHDYIGESTPTNVISGGGGGLLCCKNPGVDITTGKKTTAIHAEEVRRLGRVILVDEYINCKVRTAYRCVIHNEIHKAIPSNVLKGLGLKCCKSSGGNKIIDKHAKMYDERIAKFGKLKRIDDYINSKTPILHECLIHGEQGLQSPNAAVQGKGLTCCLQSTQQMNAENKKNRIIQLLQTELEGINPNLEWIGGKYNGNESKLEFLCKKHGEIHPASWAQVRTGCGIRCCRRENLREIGIRSLNRFSYDSVWRVLCNMNERTGETWLYLYESPVRPFNKFGISNEIEKRAESGNYGSRLIEPRLYTQRDDAVLIEQAFKYGYGSNSPEELSDWVGNTELTTLEPDEFLEVIEELEIALSELGRWDFAVEYCDPREVQRARTELAQE